MSPALVGMGQGMAKGETVQGVLPAVGRPRSVLPPSLMGTWALTPMQIRAAGAVVCPSPNLPALCLEHLLNGMATSPLYQLRDSLVQVCVDRDRGWRGGGSTLPAVLQEGRRLRRL